MFKPLCRASKEVSGRRRYKTRDIVRRVGVITADCVRLRSHPISRPLTIFNPAAVVEDGTLVLYARITVGYFKYASAVVELRLNLSDIYGREPPISVADIVVYPSNRFDMWGVEDPRVCEVGGRRLMTYCGRTSHYFSSERSEKVLPVTAVMGDKGWEKVCVFRMPEGLRPFVVSDKDAFIAEMKALMLFHRLHMTDGSFYLVVSPIPERVLTLEGFEVVSLVDTFVAFDAADFESKLGWGAPPVRVGKEFLLLLHGVDLDGCYRVFAVLMNENAEITAVTPEYIMEPQEPYEIYGDRPFTVFPCGAATLDDTLIVSYGAGDSVIGIGEIDLSELMAILDSNRLK
ncbi:MAG: glycoside hydrolase family 130 protein [Candidatus Alkanophagales archaeon]